ncbi:protein kinase [Saccharopolyspora erythraea]|uniref:protein kinase domain-containing protein n=1 Tax=Saccharopolyspora erythraea TaxID=1836 RepID=UPI001BA8C8A4|nr:protein kinase [Saccharopolyspora erythraea]QUH03931.1 protein kinase [Saccharopolyspora erythraea]
MTTLPGFDELVPLGEGPVAAVFASVDEQGGAAFALKAYPGPIDRRTRSELDTELRGLAELRARGDVLVADGVEELPDGRCALRMELCAQSLPELVGSFGPLTIPDVLALASALANALAAAHAAGIVHGGVSAGNVLFRPSGEPVLADFGLTLRRAFPGEVTAGVDFLAPETLRDGTRDERTDLYGLGAVLHFALSGSSPHQGRPGEQVDARLLRALSSEVPALERADLPAGLAQLVSALLAKNPDARPLDTATVAARIGAMTGPVREQPAFDDFGAAMPGNAVRQPSSAPPTPPVPPPAPPVPPPAPPAAAPPPPRGELLVQFGPNERARGKPRAGVVIAVAGVLSVLAVAAVVLLLSQPAKLDVPVAPAPVAGPVPAQPTTPPVRLELDDPVDKGDYVELSWRSSEPLDFAVTVAAEGQHNDTIFVQRNTEYRLRIDPVLQYCFQIQGASSLGFHESQAKPIRGAICTG